jgi:hypothetical protein
VKTVCHKRYEKSSAFDFLGKTIEMDWNGGDISSDGGLFLLSGLLKKTGIINRITGCINDCRDQYRITHEMSELIGQRISQLVMGYEDANDAQVLRYDPMFKFTAGRLPESGDDLSSQPTLSRLENSIKLRDIARLDKCITDWYIDSLAERKAENVVLDIDGTDDPTHGEQEGSLFNGFYDQTMYSPLIVCDGETGDLAAIKLRQGNAAASRDALAMIRRIVMVIKKKLPGIKIILRGDSGFENPRIYKYCEQNDIRYILGIRGHRQLEKRTWKLSSRAKGFYRNSGKEKRLHTNFKYKAQSWDKERMIIARMRCDESGQDTRYLVTNMEFPKAKYAFGFYSRRGDMENRIKELKKDMNLGRLSCHRYLANYFRLILAGFAYQCMQRLRKGLKGTEYEKAQADTIRLKILKVAVQVKETVRRVWLHYCSSFTEKAVFKRLSDSFV